MCLVCIRVKEEILQECSTAPTMNGQLEDVLKQKSIFTRYVSFTWFLFIFSNRSGAIKSELQVAGCTGWRDISNSTGHHPVERIMIDTDHCQKVKKIPFDYTQISAAVHQHKNPNSGC